MALIAFDVDGTLITYDDKPRYDIIHMLITLANTNTIIIWSGGGIDYARRWVDKLGLNDYVSGYYPKVRADEVSLCLDDEQVDLAIVNIQV